MQRTKTNFEYDDRTITTTGVVLNEYEAVDIEWTCDDEEYNVSDTDESILLELAEESLIGVWLESVEESATDSYEF